jgi:hypothetical protein
MKRIIKIPLIILGVVVVLFVALIIWAGNSPDPLEADELIGEELEHFLDSNFIYWTGWGGAELNYIETINEIFYSGKQAIGFEINIPKILGKDSFAVIIQENSKPVTEKNTIIYIKYSKEGEYSLDYIEQLNNGKTIKLGQKLNEMNDVLVQIYPDSFFSEYYEKWQELSDKDYERMVERREKAKEERHERERKEAEERAARLTPEEWAKDSIYNSYLFLRAGISDFHDYTVGNVFYTGNRFEGIVVNEPKRSGRFHVISITSTLNRSAKFDIYLNYDRDSQMSLIEKIGIKDGNKTSIVTTFEEKYATLLMLLPLLINEGNLGE